MDDHDKTPLPAARRLTAAQQLRWLLLGGGVLLLAVLAIGGLSWWARPREAVAKPMPAGAIRPTPAQLAEFKIEPVRFGATADLVTATGSIGVDEEHSTPIVLPFSGQVADVFVQAGQQVRRGQPLLSIASPEIVTARNNLLQAGAQQATAAEQVRIATDSLARQKAIYETAGGALKDYRQAQADLVNARSALRTAQSAVTAARDQLALYGKSADQIGALQQAGRTLGGNARTLYRSPVSGTVAVRNVAPGQFIATGGTSSLMTITDLNHVWLVAQLPESEAANVRLGDQVVVTTPALPGRRFAARIDDIAAALDPNTHRLPVRATVANPDLSLKPQMFASFTISRRLGGGTGVLVPSAAVIHEGDSARVWVFGRDGLVRARPVTIAESAGGFDRVTGGLAPGDRIVTAGALFVNEAGLGA